MSSTFCPIVVDAPNQQGQDAEHLPEILQFLVQRRPNGSQVIVATEEVFGVEGGDVETISVGTKKNHVLQDSMYEEVAEIMRPYFGQLL